MGKYFAQGLGTKSSRARVIRLALSLPYTVLPMAGNNENSAHHTLIFHATRGGLWVMTRKQNLCEGGQDRERKGGESLASPLSGVPNGEVTQDGLQRSVVMLSLCLQPGKATQTRTHPRSL